VPTVTFTTRSAFLNAHPSPNPTHSLSCQGSLRSTGETERQCTVGRRARVPEGSPPTRRAGSPSARASSAGAPRCTRGTRSPPVACCGVRPSARVRDAVTPSPSHARYTPSRPAAHPSSCHSLAFVANAGACASERRPEGQTIIPGVQSLPPSVRVPTLVRKRSRPELPASLLPASGNDETQRRRDDDA